MIGAAQCGADVVRCAKNCRSQHRPGLRTNRTHLLLHLHLQVSSINGSRIGRMGVAHRHVHIIVLRTDDMYAN